MRPYLRQLILLNILLSLLAPVNANVFTPHREPKDNSFFICYEEMIRNNVLHGLFSNFTKYRYVGCTITRTPCCLIYKKIKPDCPPIQMKEFSWVNNYPQALNAFYRCAYVS